MSQSYRKVILKAGREGPIFRRHPWVFSGAVDRVESGINNGDIVAVCSHDGNLLAYGFFSLDNINVKIFSFDLKKDPLAAIENNFERAFELRKTLGLVDSKESNCYRLVNFEGDSLPGLVCDIYDSTEVFQFHSIGMANIAELLTEKLKKLYSDKLTCIYSKSSRTLKGSVNQLLWGTAETEILAKENGLEFFLNYQEGQKTGFSLDQRENRKLLAQYSKNRNVLNAFSYSGGFSVYALAGGASSVVSLDVSNSATALCIRNVNKNFSSVNHTAIEGDYFNTDLEKDKFDLIILDPPALAKSFRSKDEAIRAYQAVNTKAFQAIRSGGLLFTFSCTQVISSIEFHDAVTYSAYKSGRSVKIIKDLRASSCHPVSIFHPEGAYLKGLFLEVR